MAKKIRKRTSDIAHDITDEILESLEGRLAVTYATAEKEVAETLEEYMASFATKDEIWQEALAKGNVTVEEYTQWKYGQLCVGQRWENLRNTLAYELTQTNQIAKEIAYNYMPTIYAVNFNYGTYQLESQSGIDTLFTLYNKGSVKVLFDDEDKLYHKAGIKLSKKIALNQDLAWNKQQIQSIMTQSILQGESIPKIATRLQKGASQPFDASDIKDASKKTAEEVASEVARKNRNAAIRNARTMTTYVENKGRENSYERASDYGLKSVRIWKALYDNRTRHEHRVLDGQKRPLGEPFEVDGYEIMEPADPSAPAFLVYNCRCRLGCEFEGFERKKNHQTRYNEELMGMTYDEWVDAKPESQKITYQEDVGNAIKQSYIAQYKRMKK